MVIANYIYNEVHYSSKRINTHIGIQFNKKINKDKKTKLKCALGSYQVLMGTTKYLKKQKTH